MVAPVRDVRLVFAILIGVVVFDENADLVTLMSATLIIGSGLYAFARERARRKTAVG